MTRFTNNALAAFAAIVIMATSFTAVTSVPMDAQPVAVTATMLA
ncbi:hypothetical protein [Aurantiacibacter sp. D1-12]|nr:hypothetical protein [Aurantiacibacter sp. D1-12]MDE1468484.1 hypothetical protein [Aurantiacibacter sp. D1-12]